MKITINYLSKLSFFAITIIFLLVTVSCTKEGATGPAGANGTSTNGATAASVFSVTSSSSNRTQNFILIDNPATNGNPNALVFITHDFAPTQNYLNKSIGVFYKSVDNKWGIYLEDQSVMPLGIKFNVLVYNP